MKCVDTCRTEDRLLQHIRGTDAIAAPCAALTYRAPRVLAGDRLDLLPAVGTCYEPSHVETSRVSACANAGSRPAAHFSSSAKVLIAGTTLFVTKTPCLEGDDDTQALPSSPFPSNIPPCAQGNTSDGPDCR
jgi:hypothetical protein